ncbi:MAG: hypothetical protein C0603_00765 [Denitrovibrio sp.]|nr:MAG: hypothetical protein C0603_00765 [Denitrovibrio sp.]
MKMNKLITTVVMCFSMMMFSALTSFATENGNQASVNGPEGSMAGAIPPPGMYLLSYTNYFHSDRFNDSDGNSVVPGFEVTGTVETLRTVFVSKQKFLGGNLGVQAILPFVSLSVKNPLGSDTKSGMGDLCVGVFDSWHFKNWHFAFGPEVFLPIGDYDKNDIANIGSNYYTFEPVFAFTYLSDGGFEVSSKFMYNINTENNDTNYKSGDEFHFDGFVGQHFKKITTGFNGYAYKQITDDKLNGDKYLDGNKGQVVGVGPEIAFNYHQIGFHFKLHKEFAVENKAVTDKLWFRMNFSF